jgi:hypothetical protein
MAASPAGEVGRPQREAPVPVLAPGKALSDILPPTASEANVYVTFHHDAPVATGAERRERAYTFGSGKGLLAFRGITVGATDL